MKRGRPRHQHAPELRPGEWADPLAGHAHRVENLHRITPALYRSAQPRRDDIPALKALGIRTVLSLRSFNSDERAFRNEHEIALVRVPIDTWAIDDEKVLRALIAIRQAEQKGPVLIHCWHGADRTGVVAAVYRMALQGWTKEAALQEMFRGGYGYHTLWRNIPKYLGQLDVDTMRNRLAEAGVA
jgi:protein tyrosine/serine phosphatase